MQKTCARHKQGSDPSSGDRDVALRVGNTEHTEVQQYEKMAGDTRGKARHFFLKVREMHAL